MSASSGMARLRAISYSTCITAAVQGEPQRGVVHSVFSAAANIAFPGGFILSLNTAISAHMPNGLQLSSQPSTYPFAALRPGMSVLLGAQRLFIEAIDCSLDLSNCTQWNPHILSAGKGSREQPESLDMHVVRKNMQWLMEYVTEWKQQRDQGTRQGMPIGTNLSIPLSPQPPERGPGGPRQDPTTGRGQAIAPPVDEGPTAGRVDEDPIAGRGQAIAPTMDEAIPSIGPTTGRGQAIAPTMDEGPRPALRSGLRLASIGKEMAQALCGHGYGLTPTGDDMLAGWMAINWLLFGPAPQLLEACQQIMLVARRQTHLLSQCWLGYAAEGNVALPIRALLYALTRDNQRELAHAAQEVLSLGATSGYDLIQGILFAKFT